MFAKTCHFGGDLQRNLTLTQGRVTALNAQVEAAEATLAASEAELAALRPDEAAVTQRARTLGRRYTRLYVAAGDS